MTADDLTRWIEPARRGPGVYLNNASSGLAPAPVLEAVTAHLQREAEIGAPDAAGEAEPRLAEAYRLAARLLNAEPDEIALLESGNRALQAAIGALDLQPGDRVLVSRTEWGGSLALLAAKPGLTVEVMPSDAHGRVDLEALPARLDGAKLVLLTLVPAVNGLVNPAEAVGRLAAERGLAFIVDACQAAGQLPVDVRALRCDALAASGRKWLRGPRGTSILYASRGFLARTRPAQPDQFGSRWADGAWTPRADARRFETGEAFYAGRLGLAAALKGALAIGAGALRARIQERAERIRAGLAEVPGVTVHDAGPERSGIVAFGVAGLSAAEAQARLAAVGVRTAALTAAYAPHDCAARGLADLQRISPHVFTTDDDIEAAVGAVAALARGG